MNIRCSFCQVPYAISRVDLLDALQEIEAKKLTHYDVHCPRCRRATPIPRQKLEMFMPKWRDELKKFEAEMKEHPQHEAPPPPKPEAAAVAEATPAPKPEPAPKAAKEPAAKAKPAAKPKATPAKAAPATSSPKGKTPAKKSK